MTATSFPNLGELYLSCLANDAFHEGTAGSIRDAVINAAGCGGAPDGPDLIRAAERLTRHAMGALELCISLISSDQLESPDGTHWPRLNAFFDARSSVMLPHPDGDFDACGSEAEQGQAQSELRWVIEELKTQSLRCHLIYRSYSDPAGAKHAGGIHWDWISDLMTASTFLKASSLLLEELVESEGGHV